MCKEAIAALVAALLVLVVGACDSSPDSTTDAVTHGDTEAKGDNPFSDTDDGPIQTVFQVILENPILDGELQIAIFQEIDTGTHRGIYTTERVPWTTVTGVYREFFVTALVGDVYIVRLDYRGGNFVFEQKVTITGRGEPVVAPLDVLAALPCVRYADVEDYLWTCEGTSLKNDGGFYVTQKNGECYLHHSDVARDEELWVYQGPGHMEIGFCFEPQCWNNCSGVAIPL